ncbi:hypothetical protein SDJN02_03669, partial [Cucurbita argyrosperma subsp. argyrosperma]
RGRAVLFCFADFLLQTFPSRFCGSLSLWDCAENLFAPSSGSSFKLANISLFCVFDLHRTFFFIGDHFSEIRWLKLWKNGTSKCLLLRAPISLPLSLPQSAVPLMDHLLHYGFEAEDYLSASSLLEPYPGGQEVSVLASDYQLPVLPKNG